ncbi:TPA: lipase secretion chaperone [Vibrio metschnikovii]
MMRYKPMMIALAIGVLMVTLSLIWLPDDHPVTAQPPSVLKSDVDLSSPRDFLNYLVSEMEQVDLNLLKQQFAHYMDEKISLDEPLFHQLINYQHALDKLSFSSLNGLAADWQRLHDKIVHLQGVHFSTDQQSLFTEENRIRQLAIDKQKLFEIYPQQKAQRLWDEQINQQPDYIQRNEHNDRLLKSVLTLDEQDPQDHYLALKEWVDEETIQRLNHLGQSRQQFDQQWQHYVEQRKVIVKRLADHPDQQQTQLDELRRRTFSEQDLRRVQSLERIHFDQ